MRTRPAAWILLALAATISAAPAKAGGGHGGAAAVKWEEGSRAPANTWPQDDGCPARTGASETQPFVGPREVAWRFSVSGEVEGDPLAWKSKTFIVEKAGSKHILHVLVTATGVEKYRQSFDAPLPVGACLHEGRIVLRTSSRTIQGFTVGEKGLAEKWKVTAKTAIGPPILLHDEVYVVVDGVLQRRTYGVADPVWPKSNGSKPIQVEGAGGASGVKGASVEYPRPSLRGTSVFLATGKSLIEVNRNDGSQRREIALEAEVDPKNSRVLVGLGDVLVPLAKHFKDRDRDVDTARFTRPGSGPFGPAAALLMPYGIASLGYDWVGTVMKVGDPASLVFARLSGQNASGEGDDPLASPTVHPEFLATTVPPTVAGDLVYVAGRVFDSESDDLLEADTVPCIGRVVPLRDRLLVLEAKNKVTAWKSSRKATEAPPLRLVAADGTVPAAHAVVEDDRIVSGGFVIDAKSGALRGTGKPGDAGSWPAASVKALLTDETPRRLLIASKPEDAADAVAAIARAVAGTELIALVAKAVESGDALLARHVHTAASERGAPTADLVKAEAAVAALEAKGGEPNEEKAAAVQEQLTALLAREADVLVEAASSLPSEAPLTYGAALVRGAVDRSPFHAGATNWIRTHLPPGLEPRGFQDLGDWIDFLETNAAASLRVLGPQMAATSEVPSEVNEALASARKGWRDDLVGFLNGPLLVVAPPENPGAIAKCLTLGRTVSDALDKAFSSVGPMRTDSETLVLHLFPNRGEYLARSMDGKSDDEQGHGFGGLQETAGHYSQVANVTRIFFTQGRQADSVFGTYAHELTHHWIARRRPPHEGDGGGEPGDRAGGPGYWIVEGFADFVKDFAYDNVNGKADPQNPRAEYADIVGAAPAAEMVPWPKLLTMPQSEAYSMLGKGETKVYLHWKMGVGGLFSKGHFFYAQSAATTAYLFLADGGKYRKAVLDYLYQHYAGTPDPEALLKGLGVTADELGARIVKWCKSVVH